MTQLAGPPSRGPRLRKALDDVPRYRPGRPPPVRAGARAYKASSNENPFAPLPGVLEAALSAAASMNRYPDATASGLTQALGQRLAVPADHLVAGTGSVGVLQQLVTATCGPGDDVVYAWRSFEAYPIVVRLAGARAVEVPLQRDESHDLDAMRAAISPATRLVLLCSPNNPTGTVIRQAELDAFLDLVPRDVLVVLDEAYVEFVRDPRGADGLSSYRDRPNLCLLRTFSKAYGLAGLRVGYAVAHPDVADAVRASGLPFNVSAVAQEAALASLAREPELMQRVEEIVAERSRVHAGLRAQGWSLPAAEGNFVWLRLGERTGDFAAACELEGLAVRGYGDDGVRVTVGEPAAGDLLLRVSGAWLAARQS